MFNCFVHVIMYGYYFLAQSGIDRKYLWWKKYLTAFQMFQFICIFAKSLVLIFGYAECGYPWQFSAITAVLMVLFFFLFAEFYMEEYNAKSRKSIKGKEEWSSKNVSSTMQNPINFYFLTNLQCNLYIRRGRTRFGRLWYTTIVK